MQYIRLATCLYQMKEVFSIKPFDRLIERIEGLFEQNTKISFEHGSLRRILHDLPFLPETTTARPKKADSSLSVCTACCCHCGVFWFFH